MEYNHLKQTKKMFYGLIYDYYGTGQEIEYTITYKYEVIDGLLHFSNSEGQKFIFHPSDKIYKRELIDTGEIIEQEGCLFCN